MDSHNLNLDDWTEEDFAAAAELGELVRQEEREEVSTYINDVLEEGCCG